MSRPASRAFRALDPQFGDRHRPHALAPAAARRIAHGLAAPFSPGSKTAAIINIGTATLGALIGAGGYGQPIFTGVRLDNFALILEGAIPAALMALARRGCSTRSSRGSCRGGCG